MRRKNPNKTVVLHGIKLWRAPPESRRVDARSPSGPGRFSSSSFLVGSGRRAGKDFNEGSNGGNKSSADDGVSGARQRAARALGATQQMSGAAHCPRLDATLAPSAPRQSSARSNASGWTHRGER